MGHLRVFFFLLREGSFPLEKEDLAKNFASEKSEDRKSISMEEILMGLFRVTMDRARVMVREGGR